MSQFHSRTCVVTTSAVLVFAASGVRSGNARDVALVDSDAGAGTWRRRHERARRAADRDGGRRAAADEPGTSQRPRERSTRAIAALARAVRRPAATCSCRFSGSSPANQQVDEVERRIGERGDDMRTAPATTSPTGRSRCTASRTRTCATQAEAAPKPGPCRLRPHRRRLTGVPRGDGPVPEEPGRPPDVPRQRPDARRRPRRRPGDRAGVRAGARHFSSGSTRCRQSWTGSPSR